MTDTKNMPLYMKKLIEALEELKVMLVKQSQGKLSKAAQGRFDASLNAFIRAFPMQHRPRSPQNVQRIIDTLISVWNASQESWHGG